MVGWSNPMASDSNDEDQKEWFLPNRDGDDPLGPYSTDEIIALLQKAEIRVDEYSYGSHFEDPHWERLQDIEEFKEAVISYPRAKLPKKRSKGISHHSKTPSIDFSSKSDFGIHNIYRRFPRAPYEAEAILQNGKRYCRVQCVDISERGIYLHMDRKDFFGKGEEVTITVRDRGKMETFSSSCVVMRVKDKGGTPGLGVLFLRINPQVKRKIARYVLDKLKSENMENNAA